MKNKKIAVCLCGEPRLIKYSSKSIKKFFSKLDVDFFCHVWTQNTLHIPEITKKNYTETDQVELNLVKNPAELQDYITNIYNPKKIIVEKCDVERIFGQFVIAERCVELTKEYESEYDVILKMRFDTPIAWLHENKDLYDDISKDPDAIFVNGVRMCPHDNRYYIEISDHGPFFGRKDIMYKFFNNMHIEAKNYVRNLREHHKNNKFKDEPHRFFYESTIPEYMWYLLFCIQTVKPVKFTTMYHALARQGIPPIDSPIDTIEQQINYVQKTENYARWRDLVLRHKEETRWHEYDFNLNYNDILYNYEKYCNISGLGKTIK